jgi:hypothetical protein
MLDQTTMKVVSPRSLGFLLLLIALNTNEAIAVDCPPANAKVSDAYKEVRVPQSATPHPGSGTQSETTKKVKEVELEETITVEVENLQPLLDEAKCLNKPVVLYLDERPLKKAIAYPPTDPAKYPLRFPLKRTEDSRQVWTYLLGEPTWEPRVTKVSVGIEDKFAIPSDSTINLEVIPHGWFIFWLILFVVILVGFLVMAYKTDLLRDSVPPPGGGERRPYSLGRTQTAWWFFLILASYLCIGIITGDFSTTITGTVLGLFGISTGTAMGAAFVDASKSSPAESRESQAQALSVQSQVTKLNREIDTLQAQVQTAQDALLQKPNDAAAAQDLTAKKADLAGKQAEKEVKLSQLKKLNNQGESFIQDILSDINGVSFHRFQMVALTVVLGIIFIVQVYKGLAMPIFEGTLLTLLGISAGTYVGLKIPESTVPNK